MSDGVTYDAVGGFGVSCVLVGNDLGVLWGVMTVNKVLGSEYTDEM